MFRRTRLDRYYRGERQKRRVEPDFGVVSDSTLPLTSLGEQKYWRKITPQNHKREEELLDNQPVEHRRFSRP